MRESAPRWCVPLLALLALGWLALIVAPPFLASAERPGAAVLVKLLFAPVCHQIPERSFHLMESPLGVCARCTGIYSGVFFAFIAGALGARPRRASGRAGTLLALASLPSLACWLLAAAGLIPDAALLRAAGGALLGGAVGACLVPAFEGLIAEVASRRAGARAFLNQAAGSSPSPTTGG